MGAEYFSQHLENTRENIAIPDQLRNLQEAIQIKKKMAILGDPKSEINTLTSNMYDNLHGLFPDMTDDILLSLIKIDNSDGMRTYDFPIQEQDKNYYLLYMGNLSQLYIFFGMNSDTLINIRKIYQSQKIAPVLLNELKSIQDNFGSIGTEALLAVVQVMKDKCSDYEEQKAYFSSKTFGENLKKAKAHFGASLTIDIVVKALQESNGIDYNPPSFWGETETRLQKHYKESFTLSSYLPFIQKPYILNKLKETFDTIGGDISLDNLFRIADNIDAENISSFKSIMSHGGGSRELFIPKRKKLTFSFDSKDLTTVGKLFEQNIGFSLEHLMKLDNSYTGARHGKENWGFGWFLTSTLELSKKFPDMKTTDFVSLLQKYPLFFKGKGNMVIGMENNFSDLIKLQELFSDGLSISDILGWIGAKQDIIFEQIYSAKEAYPNEITPGEVKKLLTQGIHLGAFTVAKTAGATFDEAKVLGGKVGVQTSGRNFSFNDIPYNNLAEYQNIANNRLTDDKLLIVLNKDDHLESGCHHLMHYIILGYGHQVGRKESMIPKLRQAFRDNITSDNKAGKYKCALALTARSSASKENSDPVLLGQITDILEYYGHIQEQGIKDIITNQGFLNGLNQAEKNLPLSSLFSLAIVIKRKLGEGKPTTENITALMKGQNGFLEKRSRMRKYEIANTTTEVLAMIHCYGDSGDGHLANLQDTFDPDGLKGLLSAGRIDQECFNNRGTKKICLDKLKASQSSKITIPIMGHGSENEISLGNETLTVKELFEVVATRAKARNKQDDISFLLGSCYGYDFQKNFYDLWRKDDQLKAKKILPPNFISMANRDKPALKITDQSVNALYRERVIKKENKNPLTGGDLIRGVEPHNFVVSQFTQYNDSPGVGPYPETYNDMAFLFPDGSFWEGDNGEIGSVEKKEK